MCAPFRVGMNACGLMVKTTYALAYEVKEDAFSLEQEVRRSPRSADRSARAPGTPAASAIVSLARPALSQISLAPRPDCRAQYSSRYAQPYPAQSRAHP